MNKERSILVVLSGPSGVGKDTIRNEFVKSFKNISRSVSVTTRKQGPGEVEGIDYFFRTKEEFEKKVSESEILEWDTYNGNYYGTLWETVRNYVKQGMNVVFALTIPGALALKKAYPDDTVSVFILPPGIEELERRLIGRGREDDSVIKQRIDIAIEKEIPRAGEFDYRIVNDNLEDTLRELCEIIEKEKIKREEGL